MTSQNLTSISSSEVEKNEEYIKISDLDAYIVLTKDEFRDIVQKAVDESSSNALNTAGSTDFVPQIEKLNSNINKLNNKLSFWRYVAIGATTLLSGLITYDILLRN